MLGLGLGLDRYGGIHQGRDAKRLQVATPLHVLLPVAAVVVIVWFTIVARFAAEVSRRLCEVKPSPATADKMERLTKDSRFNAIALASLRERARSELPPGSADGLSEADFARFVVARSGSVDAALAQLKTASAWRQTLLASPPTCPCCEADPLAHSHVPIGVEGSERSSVFYGAPARATDKRVDETVRRSSAHSTRPPSRPLRPIGAAAAPRWPPHRGRCTMWGIHSSTPSRCRARGRDGSGASTTTASG